MRCWRKGATDERRTQVFARYSLIGALCTAVGSLAAALPDVLVRTAAPTLGAFRLMFYAYAALGILSAALYRYVPHARGEERAAADAARAVARHRLQARGAVQPRRFCRRLRRPVAAGALAVRAFRSVAVGGRRVFLLVEHAERLLLSGRGLAREAHRPRQHHGVHAYSVQPLPDPGGVLAQSLSGARAVAAALGVVANGCADAHLLRHGGGDAGGTHGGCQRHRRAAQPRIRPSARRYRARC